MKTMSKLAINAAILCFSFAAQAEWVSGYTRTDGTSVMPYYRTHANDTPVDNLSYRGYPSQQPGYVSPHSSGLDSTYSHPTPSTSYHDCNSATKPRTVTDDYAPTRLNKRSDSLYY